MIHDDNPFIDDPDTWDPVRRFRGRLNAPVTIFTAGEDSRHTGLTVSSLIVVEGEPGHVAAVVGPTSDLWDTIAETGRFVVHVCTEDFRAIAEVFAGLRPSPGGIFHDVDTTQSKWGPVIDELGNRAYCSLDERREVGYSGIVTARIDEVDTANLTNPLGYFRGAYRSLAK